MFEASVNRQFKSRFAALNGVVHMGPISVLRRIFNGHSIDGYVLSNNFEDQLVVMKKREFEALCKYIKVDIERTSSIPRAKLIKERGLRGIDLSNSGGVNPAALIPYRDVTCGSYSNYLNGVYLNQIQPYTHMILRGMNFSHYEVISKAMQSNMANAINQAYEEYGGKINNVLSKRSYNAEEYEVALLAVAYVGIGEFNSEYLRVVCANDGSGAKAMKNKLDKYRGVSKEEKKEKVEVQDNSKEMQKQELDGAKSRLFHESIIDKRYVEAMLRKEQREYEENKRKNTYDLSHKYWYKEVLKKYPNRFLKLHVITDEGVGFTYIANDGLPYKMMIKDTVTNIDNIYVGDPQLVVMCFQDSDDGYYNYNHAIMHGIYRSDLETSSMEDVDKKIFERCDSAASYSRPIKNSVMTYEEQNNYEKYKNKKNVDLFDNTDESDFSDFMESRPNFQIGRNKGFDKVDPFANTDKNAEESFEELSKLFQFF